MKLELTGMLKGQTAVEARSRINGAPSLEAALAGAAHVQKNAPEELGVKREIIAKLDAAAEGNAVPASSSSAILPSRISDELAGKSRCLVAHPINPPHLIPAVEIVPAPWTDPQVVERTRQRLAAIGQAPIVMRRELDGFIMNRLQGALLHEAFRLVAEGYTSTEDVDAGICKGIGLRWAFMGPFETIDLNAPGVVPKATLATTPTDARLCSFYTSPIFSLFVSLMGSRTMAASPSSRAIASISVVATPRDASKRGGQDRVCTLSAAARSSSQRRSAAHSSRRARSHSSRGGCFFQ